jgi:hypothetical protein
MLRLTRQGVGIELRRGTFRVVLDGNDVNAIEWQGTIEVQIAPGQHALQIRAGRYASERRSFDVADGDVATFRCHGAMVWPRYVASIVKPDLAISLKRE